MSVKPFEKLDDVLNFTIFEPLIAKPRRKKIHNYVNSKVLLCHDMMGGYLDDKFIEGTSNKDAYRFFHWSKLDTFVYFSHNFVTIPPYGWIYAAHKHGVKVLGTIITEWENGEKLCKELLKSKENVDLFCSKICEITKSYGFDGWLLNIENKIEESSMKMLEYLAKTLTTNMHAEVPDSEVIWYDSVICTGELKWQDQLNCLNSKFFDVTDGIFLNYNWSEEKLISTRDCAQERFRDVYIGIDVFGRGTKQLEGLECHKIIQEACDSKMSLAIFAPGWVYEVLGKEDFFANECKFWCLLGELLPSKAYCEIPFKTSFCQGFGLKKYHMGKIADEKPWHNLCLQEIQPSFSDKSVYKGMEFCLTDSFNGGGCLRFHGELYRNEFIPQNSKDFGIFLLKMDVPLDSRALNVSYVYKIETGEVKVGLVLETSENLPNLLLTDVGEEFNFGDMCITINPDCNNNELSKNGLELSDTKDTTRWIARNFTIKEVHGKRLKALELRALHIRIFSKNDKVNSNFSVLLGEVSIS